MTSPMDTHEGLEPCPFCGGAMMFRKALWSSDGNVDAIIHAAPTKCGLDYFSDHTTDESVIAKWNTRAPPSPELPAGGRETRDELIEKCALLGAVICDNHGQSKLGSDVEKAILRFKDAADHATAPHAEVRDMTDKATAWDAIAEKNAEIARLRAALRDIADGYGPNHGSKYARDKASAALAPQSERGEVELRADPSVSRSHRATTTDRRPQKVCLYSDGCPMDGPVCHLCAHVQPREAE